MNKNRGHGRPNARPAIALPNQFQLNVQMLDGPNAAPLSFIKPDATGVTVFGIGGFSKHEALTYDLAARFLETANREHKGVTLIALLHEAAAVADTFLEEYARLKNPQEPPAEEVAPQSPILLGE